MPHNAGDKLRADQTNASGASFRRSLASFIASSDKIAAVTSAHGRRCCGSTSSIRTTNGFRLAIRVPIASIRHRRMRPFASRITTGEPGGAKRARSSGRILPSVVTRTSMTRSGRHEWRGSSRQCLGRSPDARMWRAQGTALVLVFASTVTYSRSGSPWLD